MKTDPEALGQSAEVAADQPAKLGHGDARGIKGIVERRISLRAEIIPLLLVLGTCLIVGVKIVGDYGESWDEADIYHYADYALGAYRFFLHPQDLPPYSSDLNYYGPAYFMLVALVNHGITAIYPAGSGVIVWHLCYFLTFLVGMLLFYLLARRSLSARTSLATCVLFLSQPLIWGHAFINPKDLPFMVFFLGSVYLGLEMVDRNLSQRPNYAFVGLAAIVLGLTISMRSIAPWAAVIVGFYALSKSPQKAVRLLPMYILLASLVAYLTWPYLWKAPLQDFMQSLSTMSRFPFPRKALFLGKYFASNELPWLYYPVMLSIQFTIPSLLLGVGGLGLTLWRFFRRDKTLTEPLLLFVGWFLLPVLAIVLGGSSLYDNARQLFFLLPPLFLMSGFGLEALMRLLRRQWLMAGAVILCIIPGVYASIQLHPYEYIYYNALAGGTGAAYGRYELDYWATSYLEIARLLNQHAAPNSTIWAGQAPFILRTYLRPDLTLSCTSETDCGQHYDYIVFLARWRAETSCTRAYDVFSVERQGTVFSLVKQLAPGQRCR